MRIAKSIKSCTRRLSALLHRIQVKVMELSVKYFFQSFDPFIFMLKIFGIYPWSVAQKSDKKLKILQIVYSTFLLGLCSATLYVMHKKRSELLSDNLFTNYFLIYSTVTYFIILLIHMYNVITSTFKDNQYENVKIFYNLI